MDKYNSPKRTYFKCPNFLWNRDFDKKIKRIYIELLHYAAFQDNYQIHDREPWNCGEVEISISYLQQLTDMTRGTVYRKIEKMFRMRLVKIKGWKLLKKWNTNGTQVVQKRDTNGTKMLRYKLLNWEEIQDYGKDKWNTNGTQTEHKRNVSGNKYIKNKELKINNNNHQREIAEYFVQKRQTKDSLNDDDNLILAEWMEKGVTSENIKCAIDIGCHRKNLNGGGKINSLKYFNDLVCDIDGLEPGQLARYVAGKKG